MQSDRELMVVYAILGQAHFAAEVYDFAGAFVLLNSIAARLGDAAPGFIDVVSHLHMVAALGVTKASIVTPAADCPASWTCWSDG